MIFTLPRWLANLLSNQSSVDICNVVDDSLIKCLLIILLDLKYRFRDRCGSGTGSERSVDTVDRNGLY